MADFDPEGKADATRAIRAGLNRSPHGEIAEALFLTSGYAYSSAEEAKARLAGDIPGYIYGRYGNPTTTTLTDRLAALEGAETARALASGMAAISTSLLAPCVSGDRIVAAKALFGSCRWILTNLAPKWGIETEFVDGADLDAWEKALSKPTKLVLIETPANPMLDGVDVARVAEMAHAAGAKLIVDNVFATPILQKPLELGADIVVYSTTKHMDGQGRTLGGAILGNEDLIKEYYDDYIRHTGPAPSPFNSWVVTKGLETLKLRVEAQSRSAAKIADMLAGHDKIAAVRYPHREDHPHYAVHKRQMRMGGTLVALSVNGSEREAFRLLNRLNVVDICNNLGDTKSLACHPATTTHRSLTAEERASMGLDDSWIRLSVGLEDCDDLCDDLQKALEN